MSTEPSRFRTIVQPLSPATPALTAIDALIERTGFGHGEIRLQGTVRDARVSMPGLPHGVDLPGEAAVVSARGLVDPQLGLREVAVILAFADRGIPQLVGGTLLEGTVASLEATLIAYDDGARAFDVPVAQPTARPNANGAHTPKPSGPTAPRAAGPGPGVSPRPAPPVPSAPTPASSPPVNAPVPASGWSSAVAASNAPRPTAPPARSPRSQVEDQSDDLRPGDLIIHPALGRCKVMAAPDSDKLKVRLPAGKLTQLHLRVVKVTRTADEDGTRVFKATIGAQR